MRHHQRHLIGTLVATLMLGTTLVAQSSWTMYAWSSPCDTGPRSFTISQFMTARANCYVAFSCRRYAIYGLLTMYSSGYINSFTNTFACAHGTTIHQAEASVDLSSYVAHGSAKSQQAWNQTRTIFLAAVTGDCNASLASRTVFIPFTVYSCA
jgi:hypothetical protein